MLGKWMSQGKRLTRHSSKARSAQRTSRLPQDRRSHLLRLNRVETECRPTLSVMVNERGNWCKFEKKDQHREE